MSRGIDALVIVGSCHPGSAIPHVRNGPPYKITTILTATIRLSYQNRGSPQRRSRKRSLAEVCGVNRWQAMVEIVRIFTDKDHPYIALVALSMILIGPLLLLYGFTLIM